MSEARLVLAAVVLAAALGTAGVARLVHRRRVVRRPLDLGGFPAGLMLFTDSGCVRCARVRRVLRDAGVEFSELAHDRDPDRFRRAGVGAVPLLVAIAEDGTEAGRIAGKVTRRALRGLVGRLTGVQLKADS